MRAWLGVFVCTACSSITSFPPGDDIAVPFDGGFDSTIPKDANGFDVVEPDATTFNGGGPFTCGNCTCDGTLDYCTQISGGKTPIVDDASADDAGLGACDTDASACIQIPIACLPKPTCDCVMQAYKAPCTCGVDPSGNGLVITCAYP